MNKNDLLKIIVDTSYNVGFAAKKHFASYDMAEKLPGLINFISMSVGILALVFDILSLKIVSAMLVIVGIMGLYISSYNNDKQKYADVAVKLTAIFNQLKHLYYEVNAVTDNNLAKYQAEYQKLVAEYNGIANYKQLMFSDWYAHYKFFWQQETGWLNEQKNFSLLRDKIPLSLSVIIIIAVVAIAVYHLQVLAFICSFVS